MEFTSVIYSDSLSHLVIRQVNYVTDMESVWKTDTKSDITVLVWIKIKNGCDNCVIAG